MKFILCFFALTATAHALPVDLSSQQLFSMTNDRDSNVDTFNLLLDARGPTGFLVKPNGHQGREETHWLKDVEKPEGVTLIEGQGHKVVILQGSMSRAGAEGRFHLKYLANGLSNQYSTCDFLLKQGQGGWFVQNAYNGQKVSNMKIITWSLGLKTLQGICAPR